MTNEKTIKEMFLFFDYLYETTQQIGAEVLADWSHKEVPVLRYCVIDADMVEVKEFDCQGVWIYKNITDAKQELNDWNEH